MVLGEEGRPNEDWQTAGLMVTIAFCHTLDFSSELLHNLLHALLQALHGIVTHARPGFDRVLPRAVRSALPPGSVVCSGRWIVCIFKGYSVRQSAWHVCALADQ